VSPGRDRPADGTAAAARLEFACTTVLATGLAGCVDAGAAVREIADGALRASSARPLAADLRRPPRVDGRANA
jgi:hypothetical protein